MENIETYILPINTTIPLNELSHFHKFDCFQIIHKYIDITPYYKILNSLLMHNIKNIVNFINIKWNIIKKHTNSFHSLVLNKNIFNHDDFNNNIKQFINNNVIICIFVINSIIKYISI